MSEQPIPPRFPEDPSSGKATFRHWTPDPANPFAADALSAAARAGVVECAAAATALSATAAAAGETLEDHWTPWRLSRACAAGHVHFVFTVPPRVGEDCSRGCLCPACRD